MKQASLLEIGTLLGHKTVQMTKRYAHLSNAHIYSTAQSLHEKLFNDRQDLKKCFLTLECVWQCACSTAAS